MKLETYGKRTSFDWINQMAQFIKGALFYLFKFILALLAIIAIILLIIFGIMMMDRTECKYHSPMIEVSGSCSQLFYIFALDGDVLKLIGADYDYNTFGIVFDWQREALTVAKGMNLTKNETIEMVEYYGHFYVDELSEAHNQIFD